MSSILLEPFQSLGKRQARSKIQMPLRRNNGTATAQTKVADATTDQDLETEEGKTTATNLAQIEMVATGQATATNHATIAPVKINACFEQQSPPFGNLKCDPVDHPL